MLVLAGTGIWRYERKSDANLCTTVGGPKNLHLFEIEMFWRSAQ